MFAYYCHIYVVYPGLRCIPWFALYSMVCVVFPKRFLLARLKSNFQLHTKQRICCKRALVESQNFSFGRKSFVRFLTWPWTPESPWESSKAPCGSGLWHSPRTGEHRFHVDVVLRCFVWLITQISLKSLQVGRHVLCVTATGLELGEKVDPWLPRGGKMLKRCMFTFVVFYENVFSCRCVFAW